MNRYNIDDQQSFNDFVEYLEDNKPEKTFKGNIITLPEFEVEIFPEFKEQVEKLFVVEHEASEDDEYSSDLIFGRDKRRGLVAIEVKDDLVYLFKDDGTFETLPAKYFLLANKKLTGLIMKKLI